MLDKPMKSAIISDQLNDDLYTSLKLAKEAGYDYVELHNVFNKSIEECNMAEIEQIKAMLDEFDLKVVNIASTIFFLCPLYPHYRVSSFNAGFHAIQGELVYHMAMLHNACRAAKALDCQYVRVFPFRFPDNDDIVVVGTKEDRNAIVEVLKQAVHIAKVYDVTLVLENCPYSHCPKGLMTFDIVEQVNDDHLRLLWDPANSYRAVQSKVPEEFLTATLLEEYTKIKHRIGHIHLKNYAYDASIVEKPFVHVALLDGDIDYVSLLALMQEDNMACVSLEPEVPLAETLQSMMQLKKVLEG